MLQANLAKIFFIVIMFSLLVNSLTEMLVDQQEMKSCQLTNYLISNNAVQFGLADNFRFEQDTLKEITNKFPEISIVTLNTFNGCAKINFYSKEPTLFDDYIREGRGFQNEDLKLYQRKAIIGKGIANSEQFSITKAEAKSFIELSGLKYEIIGIIGAEIPSKLDFLIVTNFNYETIRGSNVYLLDSADKKTAHKAYNWLRRQYSIKQMDRKSGLVEYDINKNAQFKTLRLILGMIKFVLILTLCAAAYKIYRNYIYINYILGIPIHYILVYMHRGLAVMIFISAAIAFFLSNFLGGSLAASVVIILKNCFIIGLIIFIFTFVILLRMKRSRGALLRYLHT